jgi:hypothetical protein
MLQSNKTTREILHSNRDENSFTARLFEGILFPQFYRDPSSFKGFLEKVNGSSINNLAYLNKRFDTRFPETKRLPDDLEFVDAMLFVECVDMFSAFEKGAEDKTEFDCMIFGRSPDAQIHTIVIEVKAYSDLDPGEIERQRKHLESLKNKLFDIFHHVVLISYDNLKNAGKKMFYPMINKPDHIIILTWDNFRDIVFPSDRFTETDFTLYKTIRKKDGTGKNIRHLLNH